jgi:acetyl-CoA acetyltransferase family protein
VIVEAVRTPIGRGHREKGYYKDTHPNTLLAKTYTEVIERSGIEASEVEDVIAGCVQQFGEQGSNIARNAWLEQGLPIETAAATVDRQCGSAQQAAHFAAQGVISGAYDIAIACGVETMTRVPLGSSAASGPGKPFGPRMQERYHNGLVHQGISAEMIAERWELDRAVLDAFSLASHRRAADAVTGGKLDGQLTAVPVVDQDGTARRFERDEGVRQDTSIEKLGGLKPSFKADGVITAGNSSQISDGAAALLIAERSVAEKLGLVPRARFVAFSVAGEDPIMMLTAPIPATKKVLERAGLTLDRIDRIEINEAFASVVLAWEKETHADMSRVNVNGGAIAIGHPLGASGARIMTDLLYELERSGGRYGLQTMCEGGGMANGTIIERLG